MNKVQARFPAENTHVPAMKEFVQKHLEAWHVDELVKQDMILVADEAAANIIEHAYHNQAGYFYDIKMEKDSDRLKIILTDEGDSFDPGAAPRPDIEKNLAGKRKGGFGIFLMKSLTDELHFERKDEKNLVFLIKHLK